MYMLHVQYACVAQDSIYCSRVHKLDHKLAMKIMLRLALLTAALQRILARCNQGLSNSSRPLMELPPACHRFTLARLRAKSAHLRSLDSNTGNDGNGWSVCTHALKYGFNFDYGLAHFVTVVLAPASSLELGCGLGSYTSWLHKVGGAHAVGLEVNPMPSSLFEQNDERGWPQQLAGDFVGPTASPASKRCFDALQPVDLVLSLEVLEHIPLALHEAIAAQLVRKVGRYLVFSAGHPGQSGTGHIANRPRAWWLKQFVERGLLFLPNTTDALKAISTDISHARNVLVFAAPTASEDDIGLETTLEAVRKYGQLLRKSRYQQSVVRRRGGSVAPSARGACPSLLASVRSRVRADDLTVGLEDKSSLTFGPHLLKAGEQRLWRAAAVEILSVCNTSTPPVMVSNAGRGTSPQVSSTR